MTRHRVAALCVSAVLYSCGTASQTDAGTSPSTDAGGTVTPTDSGLPFDAGLPPGTFTPGHAWANVQWPPWLTLAPAATDTIYGQLYLEGKTVSPGATPDVTAELGLGPTGTLPWADARWQWRPATFNTDFGNNDEFKATLTAPADGTWDYCFRYRETPSSPWVYADRSDGTRKGTDDGYQPANAGRLAVRHSGGTLASATLNLHCLDGSPATRLELAAQRFVALGVDVITVQEACIDTTTTPPQDTATWLAARLSTLSGQPWTASFTETHLANGTTHEGVAVLTRLPLSDVSVKVLPTVSFPRSTLLAVVASPLGMTGVATIHLSFESTTAGAQDRMDQAQASLAFTSALSPPVAATLVSGDFNSGPTAGPVGVFTGAGFTDAWGALGSGPGLTFPSSAPVERIDYLLLKGATPSTVALEFASPSDGGVFVSDHLGVSGRYAVP